uniref:Putative sulphate transporter/antisigma-factor antagonist STAS n=1 Tax=Magnetococcus massalia (strain MO-1) TaxID=451514 RepID=A0A1S7LIZ1_MAGMO|nr:Putative sulphate transporter/antisigma-factor antagonist STAS [Candidatus Magnetococcus massalia]
MSSAFQKKLDTQTNRVVITPPMDFNFSCLTEFMQAFEEESIDRAIELDLQHVRHIDSSALGMLLLIRERWEGSPNEVVLSNLHSNRELERLIEVVHFDKLFTIER